MKRYFLTFLGYIIYLELMIRFRISGALSGQNMFFLFFAPAEALFLCAFCGFDKKKRKINLIIQSVLLIILWIYYSIQLIYFNNFGSLFSAGFAGMGTEAVGNFWWALKDTVKGSIPRILLMLLPIVINIVISIWKGKCPKGVKPLAHAIVLVLALIMWPIGVLGIRAFGNERTSPYYVYHNGYSNTDTSAEKLGALTTTIVESAVFVFGGDEGNQPMELAQVDTQSLVVPVVTVEEIMGVSSNETGEETPVIYYHMNDAFDFEAMAESTDSQDLKELCAYFSYQQPIMENEYTGMFEGYNLIYICAESFSSMALNEKVTPLLCSMSESGFVFNNYYNSYMNTTTNGEFAFLTGIWPDVSRYAADGNDVGTFARSYDKYMPYGLGTLFSNEGVPTYAYHGYISSYYKRGDSWPNLGFETMKFMNEGLTFVNQWSPADLELAQQSVGDYIGQERFFTYYMTYSGHGSYVPTTYMYLKNNAAVKELLGEDAALYSDAEIAYLCGNYELELALNYIVDKLKYAGKLDNTVFVLAGDHVPYNLTYDEMRALCDKEGRAFDTTYEMYHSTCIIYNSGMEEPVVNDTYCCNVDVLPTVLNLMGIEYDSRIIPGRDILAQDAVHRARLYNGSFITDYVHYNSSTGAAEWSCLADNMTDEQKSVYLENMISYTENEYAVSVKMMDNDFYRFAYEAAGL